MYFTKNLLAAPQVLSFGFQKKTKNRKRNKTETVFFPILLIPIRSTFYSQRMRIFLTALALPFSSAMLGYSSRTSTTNVPKGIRSFLRMVSDKKKNHFDYLVIGIFFFSPFSSNLTNVYIVLIFCIYLFI